MRKLEIKKINYAREGEVVSCRWKNGVFVPLAGDCRAAPKPERAARWRGAQANERIAGLERYIARLEASAPAPEAQRPQAAPHEPDDAKPSPVATDAKDDADTLRSEPRTDPAEIQEQAAARRIKEKVLRDFANDPKEDARWLLREIGPSALDNIRAAISEVLGADKPVTE